MLNIIICDNNLLGEVNVLKDEVQVWADMLVNDPILSTSRGLLVIHDYWDKENQ